MNSVATLPTPHSGDRSILARLVTPLGQVLGLLPIYGWLAALVIAPNLLLIVTSFLSSSGGVV